MRRAYSGRARISLRRPQGMGESDRSGFWGNHASLVHQFQWSGNQLTDTGLLVFPDELDLPNPQFRSIILPADPYPLVNSRPSPNTTGVPIIGQPLPTSPGNLGFTQYVLGASTYPLYPTTMADVLARVTTNSGIPPPSDVTATVVSLPQHTTMTVTAANPGRTYLLIYNPTQVPAQMSTGTATLGGLNNISIGPGEAYFWVTAQDLGTTYQGALTAISPWGGNLPLWVWQGNVASLINNGGVLVLDGNAFPGWPTTDAGASGSVWSNGGLCCVVSGGTPTASPAIIFGSITALGLLTIGGNVLPIVSPASGSLQLWNNGGIIEVA